MGRVGSALDNAAAESFNSTVKVEYIHRHRFTTHAEARIRISTQGPPWPRRRDEVQQPLNDSSLRARPGC
jgi:transposase InsO family protein